MTAIHPRHEPPSNLPGGGTREQSGLFQQRSSISLETIWSSGPHAAVTVPQGNSRIPFSRRKRTGGDRPQKVSGAHRGVDSSLEEVHLKLRGTIIPFFTSL